MKSGEVPPLPEQHSYLDEQLSELHMSVFNRLIAGDKLAVYWQSPGESNTYFAVNLFDPLKEYVDFRSPAKAYLSISNMWQIVRYSRPDADNMRTGKSFITNFGQTGLTLSVLLHDDIPGELGKKDALADWAAGVDASANVQHELGMTEPLPPDFAELEDAMRDLREWNDKQGIDRSVFQATKQDLIERGILYSPDN